MYLIKCKTIMMFIGNISHVFKINTITRGMSCNISNNLFLEVPYIPLYQIHMLNAIRYKIILNFNYHLSKKQKSNSNGIDMKL